MPDALALPLTGGHLNVTTTSQLCSAALWRLLSETGSGADSAVRTIARNPALQAEVARVAEAVQRRAAPATGDEILSALVRVMPHYGVVKRSEAENAAYAEVYIEVLGKLPLEAIQEGLLAWGREDQGFMPNSGQLFSRAKAHAERLWMAAYRAKKAVAHVETNPPKKTAEQIAEDRRRAVEMGLIDAETGKVIINLAPGHVPKPRETPQQAADRVRKTAEAMERRAAAEREEPI